MSRSIAAIMRHTTRLMRPRKPSRVIRNVQKSMAASLVDAAYAPLTNLALKPAKPRKAKRPKAGRSSGVVVNQLRTMKSFMGKASGRAGRSDASPRIAQGAQYLTRTHRGAAGARRYKLYLPTSQPDKPKGLILMLHGCSQTPDDFAVGTHMNTLAEKHGLAVAYPAQTKSHNAGLCWNWFKPGDQARNAGEPAILAALTRKLMREFGLERDAVFVAGLSAGGAMAVILADVYPDLYSAAGVHSGLARGSARDIMSAVSAMRSGGTSDGVGQHDAARDQPVRRIIFQGMSDSTVHPSNAALIVAAAVGADAVPTKIGKRSVSGRGYARSDYDGPDGDTLVELWMLEDSGHAWSGGRAEGSFTDRKGPDASALMIRFFLAKSA